MLQLYKSIINCIKLLTVLKLVLEFEVYIYKYVHLLYRILNI